MTDEKDIKLVATMGIIVLLAIALIKGMNGTLLVSAIGVLAGMTGYGIGKERQKRAEKEKKKEGQ